MGWETPAFRSPGKFWRGSLHTHSDRSDGRIAVTSVVDWYRSNGYDFVAVTDHYRRQYGYRIADTRAERSGNFTTLIGAELHTPGTTFGHEWHILALGLPFDFDPPTRDESGRELARRARDRGCFVGLAHPFASLLTLDDAIEIDAAHALESYNAHSALEGRSDSSCLYDQILARGRTITAFAADDAHFARDNRCEGTSWVQVRARRLDPTDILRALKSGDYYSSTGPDIYDIIFRAGNFIVHTSDVVKLIIANSSVERKVVLNARTVRSWWSIPIGDLPRTPYFRVILVDGAGRTAWTNPFWRCTE